MRNTSPPSVPTAAQPLKAFKQPRLYAASLIKQQLVILSTTSMRWMIRDPCTENKYSCPPTGTRWTAMINKHELMSLAVTSETHVTTLLSSNECPATRWPVFVDNTSKFDPTAIQASSLLRITPPTNSLEMLAMPAFCETMKFNWVAVFAWIKQLFWKWN